MRHIRCLSILVWALLVVCYQTRQSVSLHDSIYGSIYKNLPQDSLFGLPYTGGRRHYRCSCDEGWKGELCDVPECKEGCSKRNGYCLEPHQCLCRLGWEGDTCDICTPYPGCENGVCKKPWECTCEPGWTGVFCNETADGGSTITTIIPIPPTDCAEYDVDYYGSDLSSQLNIRTPLDCSQLCRDTPDCKSWTWTYQPTTDNGALPHKCHLKDGVPELSTCIGCISGKKECVPTKKDTVEEFLIKKNNLLKILPSIKKEFLISFDVFINRFGPSWQNILHLTSTGRDCCNWGDRVPAVWISSKKQFYICSALNGAGDSCYHGTVATREEWISVDISQTLINGKYEYEIKINGESVYNVDNSKAQEFENVKVFATDNFYTSLDGKIRNLLIKNQPPQSKGSWKNPAGWSLAMNINPSDGHNFGYGASVWTSGDPVGTKDNSLKADFLDPESYEKNANFIAIVRHDGENHHATKVWKFKVKNKSLKEYFKTAGREIVTDGGHIQYKARDDFRKLSAKGNKDPIFGIGGDLAFNWWYSNNGARICLDEGHLSGINQNDDDTHGIGNEFGADTKNGRGSGAWWHDVANVQRDCHGGSCEVQGTDHGSSLKDGEMLGQYAIFVSEKISKFP